jgi:hypothetical protein
MQPQFVLRAGSRQRFDTEAVARVDNITVSEAVRRAITEHVVAKRSDREFQEWLDRFMSENQAILERLAR